MATMDVVNDKLKNTYKLVVMIGLSMLGSLVLFVVAAEMLQRGQAQWKGVAFSTSDQVYHLVRFALLAVGIVSTLLVQRISAAINLTREKLTNPAAALTTHSVIVFAACEFPALLGLVLFLLAGNIIDLYIFGAISLGFFAVFFPRYSRWKELAGSTSGGPTFE